MNKYSRSLFEDPIYLASIFRYLNYLENYKNGINLEHLLVLFPKFDLDPEFQSFSPYLQFFQLNLTSFNKTNKVYNAFCEHIYKNQIWANKQLI